MVAMPDPALCTDPIFILGIMRRSGTNFLYDLFRLHPDCSVPAPIWEDYLTRDADLLAQYASSVYRRWNPTWGVDEGLENLLCQCLGNGVISFLTSHTDGRRIVTKTPSVYNLRYFFKLFPRAYLLILVRDGRAVVESAVKSFGLNHEAAMRKWARSARTILHFDHVTKNSDFKYLIVKYEALCTNLEEELRRIFAFLSLDAENYDFDAATSLPVRGSSALGGQEEGSVHWEPAEKAADFNPLLRWSHWNRALHERFNWIAGQYLVQFGYEEKRYDTNRPLWAMWNKALDIKWRAGELKRIIGAAPRRVFKQVS